MIAIWGATVGKMIMRIRVVKIADGSLPGFLSSLLRLLIPAACAYIPFIGGFGTLLCYMSVFFNPKRRGWHDFAASTVVVSTARN